MKIIHKWLIGILAALAAALLAGVFFQVKVTLDMRKEVSAMKTQKKSLELDIKKEEE